MAPRTWVASLASQGDDPNPGSRTAPCRTFSGVLPKTDAGGEIDAIDPGGYDPVTINKSILIDGTTGSGFASILAPRSSAIVIKAGVNDVIVLRNLSLNGVGSGVSGIHIVSAARVIVENCVISGFQSSTGGIGIHDERTADSTLSVVDTKISNNNLGVVIETTGTGVLRSVFDNVRVYGNILHGIRIANGARSVISQSVISNNVSDGIIAEQAAGATGVNIDTCVISGNGVGIRVTGGLPTGRLNNSLVANNGTGHWHSPHEWGGADVRQQSDHRQWCGQRRDARQPPVRLIMRLTDRLPPVPATP